MDFSVSNLWNKIELAITPESQAESLVNQIYGEGGTAQTGLPDPEIGDPSQLSQPAIYVRAKQAVSTGIENVTSAIQSTFIKYALILVAVLIVAGLLYGFLPKLGARYAR